MWRWGVWVGSWWMLQYSLDGAFSLGIHIDPFRRDWRDGLTYGPYIDLHLGFVMLSFGNHPGRAENDSLMRPERW